MTKPMARTQAPPPKPPSGKDNRRFLRLTFAVLGKRQAVHELDDGFEIEFANEDALAAEVEAAAEHWRTGLPVYDVELDRPAPPEPIRFRIKGPPEALGQVEQMLRNTTEGSQLSKGLDYRLTLRGRLQHRSEVAWRLATAPLRALPDFVIIGAAKCGTSALYSHLTLHPSVEHALRKEVYFFDHKSRRGLTYYRSFFPLRSKMRQLRAADANGVARTGEATPCYLFHPHVPRRRAAAGPNAKLIAVLRNPAARAYSDYCMKVRYGLETLSFEQAIEREPERVEGELEKMLADEHYFSAERWHHSYLGRGRYAEQLERWFEHYPREQVLVMAAEEFFGDPTPAYHRVTEFLGLEPWAPETSRKTNTLPYPKADKAMRARLVEYFRPHNERLFELLGQRFDWDR